MDSYITGNTIKALRENQGLTQAELAAKVGVSDKTVSKWERAESTPDIAVLVEIAELFGVTLDYMVRSENIDEQVKENKREEAKYNHRAITYISESCAWIIALFAFIITSLIIQKMTFQWLYFVYALPVVLIIRLVFNTIWFNPRNNYWIISALMWSVLAAIHVTFLYFKIDVALIYLLGMAGQAVIVLWSFIKRPRKK